MIRRNSSLGFTLVETLVAITIMTLAILGPFAAIQRVIAQSRLAQDQLVASSLAQEGLEYVRFIRYSNYLDKFNQGLGYTSDDLLNGLASCVSPKYCMIDVQATPFSASAVQQCPSGVCSYLKTDSNGFYNLQTGTNTIFKRSITITKHASNDGFGGTDSTYETITVKIEWNDHGSQSMTLKEDEYDWL